MATRVKKGLAAGVLALMILSILLLAALSWGALEVKASGVSTSGTAESTPATGELEVTGIAIIDSNGVPYTGPIKEGQGINLVLTIFDSRPRYVPSLSPEPKATMNTGSFTIAAADIRPNEPYRTANISEIGGWAYQIQFSALWYTGVGNTFACDIFYDDDQSIPIFHFTTNINQCVETPEPVSSSSSSSTLVKGTGFVLKSVDFGQEVQAGQYFDLNAVLMATSGTYNVENVSVEVKLTKEFTIAAGSSVLYVGTVAPGQSIPITVPLTPSAIVEEGTYVVTLAVKGVSAHDGTDVAATMEISIPVRQPERFEIKDVQAPEMLTLGMDDGSGVSAVALINKGKGIIYNVEVRVEGDGLSTDEGGSSFIGNMNPGTENSADFTITASQPGEIDARIVVSYENGRGEIKELVHEFKVLVQEMVMSEGPMDPGLMPEPMPQEGGVPLWVWLAVGAVVVAGVVVLLVVLKKRKAKKAAALLEDDYDDDETDGPVPSA